MGPSSESLQRWAAEDPGNPGRRIHYIRRFEITYAAHLMTAAPVEAPAAAPVAREPRSPLGEPRVGRELRHAGIQPRHHWQAYVRQRAQRRAVQRGVGAVESGARQQAMGSMRGDLPQTRAGIPGHIGILGGIVRVRGCRRRDNRAETCIELDAVGVIQ